MPNDRCILTSLVASIRLQGTAQGRFVHGAAWKDDPQELVNAVVFTPVLITLSIE